MHLKRVGMALALLGLLAGSVWAQDDKANLAAFIGKLFNVDKSQISVSDVKPSQLIKGGREAVVTIGGNSASVYMIGDKIIVGNTYDKNYDPLKAVMEKMTLKGRPTKGKGPVTVVDFSEFQ